MHEMGLAVGSRTVHPLRARASGATRAGMKTPDSQDGNILKNYLNLDDAECYLVPSDYVVKAARVS